MKRSNERSEIIALRKTCGKCAPDAPTPKGLNMKRSNERSEIIATGETCGSSGKVNPKGVECVEFGWLYKRLGDKSPTTNGPFPYDMALPLGWSLIRK